MIKLIFGLFLIFVMLNIISIRAQPIADQKGDLIDKNGSPSTGEPYLDIIESSLVLDGSSYVGTITLNGAVPSKTSDSSIFIEWDFMIDADKNPSTSPWGIWPLAVNDIGVDYMARLCLLDSDRWGQIWNGPKDSTSGIDSWEAQGNKITLTFSASSIGGSKDIDYVVLARKYGNRGASDALIVFDKAPNQGHYIYHLP